MPPFEPIRKQKAAEQVADALRDAIVSGELAEGDPLPSERDLAEQFGVNRSTVREAILRLEVTGLVEVRQGGATRVRDFLGSAGLSLLPFLIAPGGRFDGPLLRDLLSIRVMLLSWTAEQAAQHIDEAALDRVGGLVTRLAAPDQTADALQQLDWDLFEALIRATGNRVLALLSNAVRQVYRAHRDLFLLLYHPASFDARHHRALLAALQARDGAAAHEAMRQHALAGLAVATTS
jgi:DNA-binding FadR family transcriptional regulator